MEKNDSRRLIHALLIAGIAVGFLFFVHLIFWLGQLDPGLLGIMPRRWMGLTGILTSPFVHGDWAHFLSNAAPLFVMISASVYFYAQAFRKAVFWMFLMTGAWVWIAGHSGSHIGASGMVYALAGFLFFSGVFRRHTRNIALSLVIAFFYGGLIWGVLPLQKGVSWESHLFGLLAGVVLAWYFRRTGLEAKKKYSWDYERDDPARDENAIWNYRENWSGAQQLVVPTNPEPEENHPPKGQFPENHYL